MKDNLKPAPKGYNLRQQFIVLFIAGALVVLVIPYLTIRWSHSLDQRFNLPKLTGGALNPLVGALLIVGGLSFAQWSIYAQITIGRGTPVPLLPTQKLVVKPPFTYCRNPMTLGTIVAYLGVCVWLGSLSALGIVLIFTLLLLLYIKLIEEKELVARFGQEYLDYKHKTPFILPRFRSTNKGER